MTPLVLGRRPGRPLLLTILLTALPLLLLFPGVQHEVGPTWYRVLVIWGLPAVAGLVAAAFVPRLPKTGRLAVSGSLPGARSPSS